MARITINPYVLVFIHSSSQISRLPPYFRIRAGVLYPPDWKVYLQHYSITKNMIFSMNYKNTSSPNSSSLSIWLARCMSALDSGTTQHTSVSPRPFFSRWSMGCRCARACAPTYD